MLATGRAASLSVALAAIVGCATGRTTSSEPTPMSTARPSECPAPALTPGYLPDGVAPAGAEPIFATPEHVRTWTKDGVVIQLGEGFSADHGEEPDLKHVDVRGDRIGNLLATEDPRDGSDAIVVDWAEDTRCGHEQYLVVTKGLSEDETLRIARSLEGDTT
jgi:hypothetical protein